MLQHSQISVYIKKQHKRPNSTEKNTRTCVQAHVHSLHINTLFHRLVLTHIYAQPPINPPQPHRIMGEVGRLTGMLG